MRSPISDKVREAMFAAWSDKQTVPHVVRTCAVSKGTARKYKEQDGWVTRLSLVRQKARHKLDDDSAQHTVDTLKLIKSVRQVYITSLVGSTSCPKCAARVPVPKMKPIFGDVDKIVRLEEFIRGKPDSRPDIGRTLDQMSDEDLLSLQARSTLDICGLMDDLAKKYGKVRGLKKDVAAIVKAVKGD